jgi:adenylate cyclase
VPDFPVEDRDLLRAALAAFDDEDADKRTEALAGLKAVARKYPDDAGLANLVYRYEYIGDGGIYGLG